MQLPPDPRGSAIQRPPLLPYASALGYQGPYFLPRYSHRSPTSSSLSGYWCASSLVDRMMSGPLPMFAATAALGRMTSQFPTAVVTSTPVFTDNLHMFASHSSSST